MDFEELKNLLQKSDHTEEEHSMILDLIDSRIPSESMDVEPPLSALVYAAQGIILVYDSTDRRSFEDLTRWFEEIRIHVTGPVDKVIVGNKVDKDYQRQVPTAEAAAFAKQMGCHFVETSAKTARGVRKAFRNMVERIVENPELRVVFKPNSPQISFTPPQDLRFLRYCSETSAQPQKTMSSSYTISVETVEAV